MNPEPNLSLSAGEELCASNCSAMSRRPASRGLLLGVLLLFVAVNLAGNSTVILSIVYFRRLQTRTNALTLSLAATDLLVGALVMPFSGVREAHYCWFFGRAFCRLHTCLDYSLTTSSIVHLACVAADRYVSISDPMRYREWVTPPVIALMVVLCWLSLAGYGVALLAFWPAVMVPESCPDTCNAVVVARYALANTLCAYLAPLALMMVVYARIYQLARMQSHRIKALALPAESPSGSGSLSWQTVRREHNATLTLSTLGGVFVLCWVPYFVASSLESFLDAETATTLVDVANWFTYVNSTVNPVLIVSLNRSFRAAVRLLLGGRAFARTCRGTDLGD